MRSKIKKYIDKNIIKDKFTNKNVFITGANSGIGLDLAKEMAYLHANLFLLCRNLNKAELAKNEILSEFPDTNINLISLDLADFDNIKNAAKEICNYQVDYFVNNAGAFRLDKSFTKNNIEITMGTNFIGTLLLNDLVLPNITNKNAHICFETSVTSRIKKIDYDDFFLEKNYKKMKIYARSKYCINNIFFNYLDEYKSSNLIFDLSHPGGVYTPLIKKGYKNKLFHLFACAFMKLAFHKPDKAALSILFSLNEDETCISGPRGIGEISGYPKKVNFKKNDDYKKCIALGRSIIINHDK